MLGNRGGTAGRSAFYGPPESVPKESQDYTN